MHKHKQFVKMSNVDFRNMSNLTSRKLFSKATRMLVSILVLFFRLRLIPSMPMPGEPRVLGLDKAWSDVRLSAQTAPTQTKGREVKQRYIMQKYKPTPLKQQL